MNKRILIAYASKYGSVIPRRLDGNKFVSMPAATLATTTGVGSSVFISPRIAAEDVDSE